MTQTPVQFLNLDRLYQRHKDEILGAVFPLLEGSQFIGGEPLDAFEEAFAQWLGKDFRAAGCGNGTDAITLAALAMELPPGSEALVPAMTFVASVEALIHAGLTVKLVDVDPATGLMDLEQAAQAVTDRTRLLVPVHLFGQMVNMETVKAIADKHQLRILEDSAQAHGAKWKGNSPGFYGDVATFSFFPGKNLGAWGDGGAVAGTDPALVERCSALGKHGGLKKYHHDFVGMNSRLDTVQAAVLTVKLKYLNEWNQRRRDIAKHYDEVFGSLSGVEINQTQKDAIPVYHLYVVRVPNRAAFQEALKQSGIPTGIHYPKAIHQLEAFQNTPLAKESYPQAERYASDGVSLPLCPFQTDAEVEQVCAAVKKWSQTL